MRWHWAWAGVPAASYSPSLAGGAERRPQAPRGNGRKNQDISHRTATQAPEPPRTTFRRLRLLRRAPRCLCVLPPYSRRGLYRSAFALTIAFHRTYAAVLPSLPSTTQRTATACRTRCHLCYELRCSICAILRNAIPHAVPLPPVPSYHSCMPYERLLFGVRPIFTFATYGYRIYLLLISLAVPHALVLWDSTTLRGTEDMLACNKFAYRTVDVANDVHSVFWTTRYHFCWCRFCAAVWYYAPLYTLRTGSCVQSTPHAR